MPTHHAKLSASGAHRWLACPGSVALEENLPDTTSEYAAEGTLAHTLAEITLKARLKSKKPTKTQLKKIEASPYYSKEMDGHVETYTDEIIKRTLSYPHAPYINIEERVDFSAWVPEGFGTCDCVMIYGDEMQVIDLKYGKGVPVSPEHNPQLMLYGLGALNAYGFIYNIKKVRLTIIQPRLNSVLDWEISAEDLLTWAGTVKPISEEAFRGSERLSQGDHCRFCKAKSRCPERAKQMFKGAEEVRPVMATDLALISNEDIARYLQKTKGIAEWIKDLEEEALMAILAGEEIPGYKAVEGRSIRAFKDTEKAMELLLAQGYEEAILYEKKPLSLSKLEKLIGKKDFGEIMGDEIVKPQGKPTLVEETDKRPAYVKDLGFEKID